MRKPVIGITMGDPAGIGPEIVAKALRNPQIRSLCHPVVFGTSRFLPPAGHYESIQHASEAKFEKRKTYVVEVKASGRIRIGKGSASSGKAALAYVDKAVKCALCREVDAIVTAPVSKAAIRAAGARDFIGHTEFLAEMTGAASFAMMFYSKRLKVTLATTHLPLRLVAACITITKSLDVITLSSDVMKKLGSRRPHIGVAGLNPHAGEQNAFGAEDSEIIAPAVRLARRRGIHAEGPVPADTLFRAAHNGDYDLVVAMYHDQGLAPFKMVAFDEGVNVTLGLPIIRTSVDHGTAFDIAGKGIASEKSLIEAIKLAVRIAT